MQTPIPPKDHVDKLKIAAAYLSTQKGIRSSGWGSLGWGAFTLLIGIVAFDQSLLSYVELGLGVFLVIEGAWLLKSPGPKALLGEAVALGLLGLQHTVGLYLYFLAGVKPIAGGRMVIVGIAQLANAFGNFKSYPKAKEIFATVDQFAVSELEHMMPSWKDKAESRPDLVEFKAEKFEWKLRPMDQLVIGLTQKGNHVVLARKSEFGIENVGKAMMSKDLKIKVTFDDETFEARIKPDQLERLEAWLTGKPLSMTAGGQL